MSRTDEFRAGYEFGYGDGQVGEYQPEKHRAAHAPSDHAAIGKNLGCDHRWRDAGHVGVGTTRSICLKCGKVLVVT